MRTRTRVAASLAAAGVVALAGCGTDVDDITVGSGKGWPAAHHDGRNSAASPVSGASAMTLSWSRPVGGPIAQPVTIGGEGQLFVTTSTGNCAVFSYQMQTGRKRFCNPLGPSTIEAPTVVDGINNVYVGDDGAVNSFNYLGQPRWRTPVAGVPVAIQFTGDGRVLTVTQSGQVDVLSRQTGEREVPTLQLLGEPDFLKYPGLTRPASGDGLDDCQVGGPRCAVANTTAVDPETGRFFVTVWEPGKPMASLRAMSYADGTVTQLWSADMLTDGSATSPALSSDGATVYVGDNSGRLIAVNTEDGSTRWTHALGWTPRGRIALVDDLILPSGDDGYLAAIRDHGDRADRAWERKDLAQRGTPALTSGEIGYTVAAIGAGLNLITFDTTTGTTIDSDPLPNATGTTTGTSMGPEGQVVVATRLGEIFTFTPDA
ncbi:outer membrane protein assembly factor BamB family protein [Nocardia sp. NPDC003979]